MKKPLIPKRRSIIWKVNAPVLLAGCLIAISLAAGFFFQTSQIVSFATVRTADMIATAVRSAQTQAQLDALIENFSESGSSSVVGLLIVEKTSETIISGATNEEQLAINQLSVDDLITLGNESRLLNQPVSLPATQRVYYRETTLNFSDGTMPVPVQIYFLFSNNNAVRSDIVLNLLRLLATDFAGLAFILLLIWWLLKRHLIKPLKLISKKVSKDNKNVPEEIIASLKGDELALIANQYNQLVESESIIQQELRRSREIVDNMTDIAPVLLSYVDQHLNYRYVNKTYEAEFNQRIDDIVGKNMRDVIGEQAMAMLTPYIELARQTGKAEFEFEPPSRGDGNAQYFKTQFAAYYSDSGDYLGFFACSQNITVQKQAQHRMAEYAAEMEYKSWMIEEEKVKAEAAASARSMFLASMSHEIRTPMNGVVGMLELLMHSELNQEQRQRANLAKSSAESLLTIINDILDFSKIESGKLMLDEVDFDLVQLFSQVIETFAQRADEKGIELILDLTYLTHQHIETDPGRVRQILNNLIGNALKFTEQGEVIVRPVLKKDSERSFMLCCDVIDTGIGLTEEQQEIIFDTFSQADASTTRKYGGTGLGLSIVKRLCELMTGTITVFSDTGKGSTFRFEIQVGSSANPAAILSYPKFKRHILIVSENTSLSTMLNRQLDKMQCTSIRAPSGVMALNLLNQGDTPFDLVLIDHQVSDFNQADLIQQLKKDCTPQCEFLVFKPAGWQLTSVDNTETGNALAISKPVTPTKLLDQLEPLDKTTGDAVGNPNTKTTRPSQPIDQPLWSDDLRILVVEDVLVNQMVIRGLLKSIGLSCDVASDGQEALDCIISTRDTFPYHLVLMDCNMPEMDGFEATRRIRQGDTGAEFVDLPIVAMTANAMKGDREYCIAAGMNDYLSKPVSQADLVSTLKRYLPEQPTQTTSSKTIAG